ncbi:zinc finger SWIM domain-containing protein 3 [Bufo bufo]|uniref:zinc finger SWIM domain-containing protein 3 n=1 Tax=Bufo bufo TaxID=8384 RepID=UPI001ABED91D|nr:zinc finger SWIM domain-containing protein 3 [Bufo bufo]
MQRGACFTSYEDFKESFTAYQDETESSYSIQSSVSVQHHNSRFSTSIRPDVTFTEVKFCCSKLQRHNGKRKPQDGVCPAYFFLQYDMDLDCLVVKEECLTHVHSNMTNPSPASLDHPFEAGEHEPPDLEVPSKKTCNKSPLLSVKKENDQDTVQQEIPSPCEPQSNMPVEMQDIGEGHSKCPSATIEHSSSQPLSIDILNLDNIMKDFQKANAGSQASLTTGGQNQPEQLSFQTPSMTSWFLKFPESLLLHRVSSKHGYIVYAFLVETKERLCKIVHFSFVEEDNAKNVSKMLEMFKLFNSEWPKVKFIQIDVAFGQMDPLKEAFPSVQVLLSVYHTARLIERKIKGPADFKICVHKWLEEAVCNTTPQKLNFLAEKLEHKLDRDLYAKLCKDWFSNELLWYTHVKKGAHSCSTYMESIGMIDEAISSCLTRHSSMENAIQDFLKSADGFINKGLEMGGSKNAPKGRPKKNLKKLYPILPALKAPPPVSEVSTKPMKDTGQSNKKSTLDNESILRPTLGVWRPIKLPNKMLLSLKEFCNDVGFQLCVREWEVVQRSVHLISEQTDFTAVQILEETHRVSLSGHSCTCYFNTGYRLPCRHILSMLYEYEKPIEEDMVSFRWRKDYVKPILDSKLYGKVLHHTKSKSETMARIHLIKSLMKEFSNLLVRCDASEMKVRVSTLQMIVDTWHNDPSGKKKYPMQDMATELPYRWVKKEPIEAENGSGYELCRLDPEQPEWKMTCPDQ